MSFEIEIIPAIDVIDGKCVRLSQGDFSRQTTYSDDPHDMAIRFEDAGLRRLHIVDLDGAKSGKIANLRVLESIARNTGLTIDFGGGIKTDGDISSVFNAGASMAAIGSVAVRSPETFGLWIESFGAERFLLGADVKGRQLAIDGWQTETESEIVPFLEAYLEKGIRRAFVTDIAKDGLLEGPSIELYKEILDSVPKFDLIASGGVGSIEDIAELERIGCTGVIVGKAIYEGKISLKELGNKGER